MFVRSRKGALFSTSALAGFVFLGLAATANAQDQTFQFDIPSEPLDKALTEFSKTSSQQIVFSEDVTAGKRTPGLRGRFTVGQALTALLAGTGLVVESGPSGVLMVRQKREQAALEKAGEKPEQSAQEAPETIVVTGSRISGAPPTSPVIAITQDQMREAGQNTLSDAIKAIPQNYNGGQNPGVLGSAAVNNLNNQDVTGASSINLRGLGPDATLTLLNGHRLAYNGADQAIDISAIPLDAVNRIEIVADGASAIYGSDAVAGVANIILNTDFDGVSARAHIGAATDGGDRQSQLSGVAGTQWDTGGVMATYSFLESTDILASQRRYTSYLSEPFVLLPRQTSNSGVVSAHQALASWVEFNIDATYNTRSSGSASYLSAAETSGSSQDDTSYSLAPALKFSLPADFTANLVGTYGADQTTNGTTAFAGGSAIYRSQYCYCNTSSSAELNFEGPLLALPGGDVRIAAGGGFRENTFDNYYTTSSAKTYGQQSSYYVFGESYLPVIAETNGVELVREFSLTGAARYEKYDGLDGVLTPKVGALYSPLSGLDFKASWGKSFKAPTLQQQFSATNAYLFPASLLGIAGYPAGSTILFNSGGNPDLKPERATTWSATVKVTPPTIPDLVTELSYFDVTYTDRIVQPVAVIATAFTIPAYRQFLILNPSQAAQSADIAKAQAGLQNYSGGAYNPANVVALLDDPYTNATFQHIDGVDFSTNYSVALGGSTIELSENMSWLEGEQKTTALSPAIALAGTVYNPPHFRSRTGITVRDGDLVVSAFYNYLGGVTDNLSMPYVSGDAMSTVDVAAIFHVPEGLGPLPNVEFELSAQNIGNAAPPYLAYTAATAVRFDPSNYSDIGRFISFSVATRW